METAFGPAPNTNNVDVDSGAGFIDGAAAVD